MGKGNRHNDEAEWIKNVEEELKREQQTNVTISVDALKKRIAMMANWKAPGPDGVQGYWIKTFRSLHERLATQMMTCLEKGEVPVWMTRGRTVLIMKDPQRGSEVSNYRPITCLPLLWKLFTGLLSDEIYRYLELRQLLPIEQKGCRRNSRGTKDQMLIDKMVMKNCKRRKTSLSMIWLDYKKAYDMIPHS